MNDKRTQAVLDRFRAGDPISEIAEDLGIPVLDVEQVIRDTGCMDIPLWMLQCAITSCFIFGLTLPAVQWIQRNYGALGNVAKRIVYENLKAVYNIDGSRPAAVLETIEMIDDWEGSHDDE